MILALVERDRRTLHGASLETLTLARGLARELGTALEAVLIGEDARPLLKGLGDSGVSKVHVIRHERLKPEEYAPEAWALSAVQHMVGCKGAKCTLVINTDEQGPILSKADYAVIGDLRELIPALIEELKKARGNVGEPISS